MEAKVITLANKLHRIDSLTGMDVWYKTILKDIAYKIEKVTNVAGSTVSMGQTFIILIPFDNKYKPYEEWCKLINKENFYTIRQGDFIFLDREIEEIITPNTIQQIKLKYEPKVCEVKSIEEVPYRTGIRYRLKVSGI